MAIPSFLVQGLSKAHGHLSAVQDVLRHKDLTSATISVAFATAKGVALISDDLRKIASRTNVFVGIRNGVSTAQALTSLIDLGIHPHCVDTGSNSIIFHPKVYLSQNKASAKLLIGSSNMTPAGLSMNFEAACAMELALSDKSERDSINTLDEAFSALRGLSKDHVYQVKSKAEVVELFLDGLLVDERRIRITAAGTSNRAAGRSRIKLIPRQWSPPPIFSGSLDVVGIPAPLKPKTAVKAAAAAATPTEPTPATGTQLGFEPVWDLVWVSDELSERDLNIPKGANTNPTGSMLFRAGAWKHISFQTYFRESVFDELDWVSNNGHKFKHLAKANFEFRIGGVSHGVYRLEIGHKSDKSSKSYKQKNAMTNLRWGEAKSLIARDDLLGRSLNLYKAQGHKDLFLIEID